MRQIPVILPWSFEDAVGYPGGFRWVAFFWEPCGDEAMYDDGYCSTDGNPWGFLQFISHPKVRPWLAGYYLGSSDSEAAHWLLCDLESRDVFVGEPSEVKEFLVSEVKKYVPAERLPEKSLVEISPEEWVGLFLKFRNVLQEVPVPSMAEIQAKVQRDKESVEKMVAELAGGGYE